LDNCDFQGVVEEAWREDNREGWMSFVLKEKLKALKGKLRSWHKAVYRDMARSIDKLVEDILAIDVRGEVGFLSDEDVQIRKDKFSELWRLLKAKEENLIQRARSRWMKEGDANSKYFS
jgi:hypothetical protein